MFKSYQSFITEVEYKPSEKEQLQHNFVQGHLADKDIDSKLVGKKTLVVDKTNVSNTKKHLKSIGHHNDYVVLGEEMNELSEVSKELLGRYLVKSGREIANREDDMSSHRETGQRLDKIATTKYTGVSTKTSNAIIKSAIDAKAELNAVHGKNFDKLNKRKHGFALAAIKATRESLDLDEAFTTHKPESYTDDLEGTVIPIHNANLSKLKGFEAEEDEDGYSKTHMVKCGATGQVHTAYTRNGELRIRPYGKVASSTTEALVKHLTPGLEKEKKVRESEELSEVSKELLGRYIKKASDSAGTNRVASVMHNNQAKEISNQKGINYDDRRSLEQGQETKSKEAFLKAIKRRTGISKAVDKLTKDRNDAEFI